MKDHANKARSLIEETESDEGLTLDQRIAIAQVHATLAVLETTRKIPEQTLRKALR